MLVGKDFPLYSEKYLKESLKKYYGDGIYFTNQERRKDVVCFSNHTANIIREHHETTKVNTEDRKTAIIKTAASLIANDIKCLNFNKDEYPSLKEMTSHYELPESLEMLLTCLFPHSSVRRNIVGQNVISSRHPRSS